MAEASTSLRSVVRSLSRELEKGSLNPRSAAIRRTEPLPRYLEAIVRRGGEGGEDAGAGAGKAGAAAPAAVDHSGSADILKRLENIQHLIVHTRIHEELLARYNPVYGKSEAERIRATANRVGWDVPIEYQDESKKNGSSSDTAATKEIGIDQKYRS